MRGRRADYRSPLLRGVLPVCLENFCVTNSPLYDHPVLVLVKHCYLPDHWQVPETQPVLFLQELQNEPDLISILEVDGVVVANHVALTRLF